MCRLFFLTITIGLCLMPASMSHVTPVTATWKREAIFQTVVPAPGPRALSAMLAIFNASWADNPCPATANGVGLFLNLNVLPMR